MFERATTKIMAKIIVQQQQRILYIKVRISLSHCYINPFRKLCNDICNKYSLATSEKDFFFISFSLFVIRIVAKDCQICCLHAGTERKFPFNKTLFVQYRNSGRENEKTKSERKFSFSCKKGKIFGWWRDEKKTK